MLVIVDESSGITEEIWSAVVATVRDAMGKAGVGANDIAGIGITNQRETTIVWDRATGSAIDDAVVWQCRRTAGICEDFRRRGLEPEVRARTGLLIDAYFSGTKVRWLLDHAPRREEDSRTMQQRAACTEPTCAAFATMRSSRLGVSTAPIGPG